MRSDGQPDSGGSTGSPPIRDDDGGGRRPRLTNRQLALGVAAIVVAIDQLTKWWAVNALADGPIDLIDHIARLRLLFNTGASFSIMPSAGPLLAIVALGVVGLIVYALGDASKRLEAVALGLVLGGAVGNLADRVFRGEGLLDGAVVDFIDVSVFTFNVADAAINIGVALLLLAVFIHRK